MNLDRRKQNWKIFGGRSSRCLQPSRETRGLWSVSKTKLLPRTYSENVSDAQVQAKDLEANAIGFQVKLCFCINTVPNPKEEL